MRQLLSGPELGALLRNQRAAYNHRGDFLGYGFRCLTLEQIVELELTFEFPEIQLLLPTRGNNRTNSWAG